MSPTIPPSSSSPKLSLDNVTDGEQVHQRCVLISGHGPDTNTFVIVSTADEAGRPIFPDQQWPTSHGYFKALLMLAPGVNSVKVSSPGFPDNELSIKLTYIPLLQNPPLHLAILIAKDSPLLIDCSPAKHAGISSTHSSLEAAIAKFRTTAYMWQALTAEDMRAKGLGRRCFRLEEEWSRDTLSRHFLNAQHEEPFTSGMQSTAKVHLVRTEMTTSKLRDMERAQQNPDGQKKDELHDIFSQALKNYGGVFESGAHPVVAGLILDSHYSMERNMILAHAALGAHNAHGLSLGVMGSHLTYSWPRFLEEVPDCLLDITRPGNTVGNDAGECTTMWEACSVGQGAFLHEVGHAFSAPHTTGIMARGYSQHWPRCFLSKTAYCACHRTEGIAPVTKETPNEATWDIRDAFRFKNLPHFQLPSDPVPTRAFAQALPKIKLLDDEDFFCVKITSECGIAQIWLNGKPEDSASISSPLKSLQYTLDELESRFKREEPLEIEMLSMNGRVNQYSLWELFSQADILRVPGTNIRLLKKSVGCRKPGAKGSDIWEWAVMLKKRNAAGKLIAASKIDLRVGCALDGAIVYYKDGSKMPCGPRNKGEMGGHQARKLALPSTADITKVEVSHPGDSGYYGLSGLRMHLSNGKAMGALNRHDNVSVDTLEPPPDHKIIGFYGRSGQGGICHEFGVVSAPKDMDLPDSMYNMPELQNIDGGNTLRANKRSSHDGDMDMDVDTSEDEDEGYDDDCYDSD